MNNTKLTTNYVSPNRGNGPNIPYRDRISHGSFIANKLRDIWNVQTPDKTTANYNTKEGVYIEFKSADNETLPFSRLDIRRSGIRLLNVRKEVAEDSKIVKYATVYIPNSARGYFANKVNEYLTLETTNGNPKNRDFVNLIEDLNVAIVESFWLSQKEYLPREEKKWCEIWLRNDEVELNQIARVKSLFEAFCTAHDIEYKPNYLMFPERVVTLIYADIGNLNLFVHEFEKLAEFRIAPVIASQFTDLSSFEQTEWAKDLLSRLHLEEEINNSICIFDTGVNNGNMLLRGICSSSDRQAYDLSWGVNDHDGHGTKMAGIASYFNLEELLLSSDKFSVTHNIESVKILPPKGGNSPDLYGYITNRSFSLVEINAPQRHRVYCMAVSSEPHNTFNGTPTSWSAEVDNLASGAHDKIKRLIILSAGNVDTSELKATGYKQANYLHSIESPGQAWNAITVGCYTAKDRIQNSSFTGFVPVAQRGDLSPFSSTSITWDNKWPIKPELVCEGGNVAKHNEEYSDCEDLSLLTTSKDLPKLFDTINATSSATAQASYIAAKIFSQYREYWPETVRALMIHSADWNKVMTSTIPQDFKKSDVLKLLRTYGYGIPNLEKAIWTTQRAVNMVIQDDLVPYKKDGSAYKTNEMHYHELPWPTDLLRELADTSLKIRVKITLSYFIEPGPGEIGWQDRYRYASSGLRFDMNNPGESLSDFQARVNMAQRDEEQDAFGNDSGRWLLGAKNRSKGSVHSDSWIGSPSELINTNYIAVYPVIGWWRERHHLNRYRDSVRYSLIVSIESLDAEIDLYTPIMVAIEARVPISVEVDY